MNGLLLYLRFVERRISLEIKRWEADLGRQHIAEARSVLDVTRVIDSELLPPCCDRRGRLELLVVIPYGRGASVIVPILLLQVPLVRRTEKLEEVELQRAGVQLAENGVRVVGLRVSLLEEHHAV